MGSVAPDVIPDVVGKKLRAAATVGSCSAGEDAVNVGEEATSAGGEIVALVQVDAHGVDCRYANNCMYISAVRDSLSVGRTSAIESRYLVFQLLEDTLYHSNTVQLVTMNGRRKRQLLACFQTLRRSSCDHYRDMNGVSAIANQDEVSVGSSYNLCVDTYSSPTLR